jgi:hypothetical protein
MTKREERIFNILSGAVIIIALLIAFALAWAGVG